MIARDTILDILRDGCRAPSGDNSQPWRFLVRADVIRVVNVPEKDTSLFNFEQMTNHVALGTCVENVRISAEGRGLRAEVTLFPDASNRLAVASIALTPDSNAKQNGLAPYIQKRATNRKSYHAKQIKPEVLSALTSLASDTQRVAFVDTREEVAEIARTVSAGEKLALEDKSIHDFLFSHVTWTKEEDAKKHGFLIDTFEFAPPQKGAFKLFSHWNILKLFIPLGISSLIAKDMEKVHRTSAAFGAIVLSGRTGEDYLKAGILLERLWLTMTKLGLALQPTTTVNFIGTRVLQNDPGSLSAAHQALLRAEYAALAKAFRVAPGETIGFVFRIGYADAPSAQTTRFEPDVTFED